MPGRGRDEAVVAESVKKRFLWGECILYSVVAAIYNNEWEFPTLQEISNVSCVLTRESLAVTVISEWKLWRFVFKITGLKTCFRTDFSTSFQCKPPSSWKFALIPDSLKAILFSPQKVDLFSLGIIFFEMSYHPMVTASERIFVLTRLRDVGVKYVWYINFLYPQSRVEIRTQKQDFPGIYNIEEAISCWFF